MSELITEVIVTAPATPGLLTIHSPVGICWRSVLRSALQVFPILQPVLKPAAGTHLQILPPWQNISLAVVRGSGRGSLNRSRSRSWSRSGAGAGAGAGANNQLKNINYWLTISCYREEPDVIWLVNNIKSDRVYKVTWSRSRSRCRRGVSYRKW